MLKKSEERASAALKFLPGRMSDEIRGLCAGRGGVSALREIRVRREGRASVKIKSEKVFLSCCATSAETDSMVRMLTGGALYAHRDEIASGFISPGNGIRVGAVGTAAYEGGAAVGISDIRALLFRIPTGECAFSDRLYSVYRSGVRSGMLIYSPPGVGKTTALRSLAHSLGGGEHPLTVAVIDERREFLPEDYLSEDVDILTGYSKRRGLEIATRTMSPDVIMIDEIGQSESGEIGGALMAGVPIVATAHAGSYAELLSRKALMPLIEMGAFDVFVGICEIGGSYSLTVDRR